MTPLEIVDPQSPHKEAAFFYGLFLRGHSLNELRENIDIPRPLRDKWMKARDFNSPFKEDLNKVYEYRKRVLAIFDGLVSSDSGQPLLQ